MDLLQSICFLMGLVLFYQETVSLDVVRVRRGQPAVLQCDADPGDTLLQVTWKLHLYNSSCIISYRIEEDNTKTSYSSCSARMRSDNLSLSISNTEVSHAGNYTCEVVHGTDTVIRYIVLQVLVQPSTYLTVTSDGSPECGAIGGNPPAEISWIPHSDDINTTVVKEPDRTWSVISTLRRKGMNGTSVTCVVSHPTLVNPWKEAIILSDNKLRLDEIVIIIVTVKFIVLTAGFLLYIKRARDLLMTVALQFTTPVVQCIVYVSIMLPLAWLWQKAAGIAIQTIGSWDLATRLTITNYNGLT
ncbi:cell surface glycoprotein CD200 receptor 2-like [Dendropsophus ebraccatus]|uniref:cell surface glycoprotein CD200 receptor 2-like n=1 Tax=Dendropsophus ebraccatus TaxID=150705 RepID=UPI003831851D